MHKKTISKIAAIIASTVSLNAFALSPELVRNGSFSQNKTAWISTSATDFSLNNEAGNLTANLLNNVQIRQSVPTVGPCNLLFSVKSKQKTASPGTLTVTVGQTVLNLPVNTTTFKINTTSVLFNMRALQKYNMNIFIKGNGVIIDNVSGKCQ